MRKEAAKDEVLEHAFKISDEQFEQLCKIIIEEIEKPRHIELTPFRGDEGIDVWGEAGTVYDLRFGAQVKQHTSNVGSPAMRNFMGALNQHQYQTGVYFSISGFSKGAIEVAEKQKARPIKLFDSDGLTGLMLAHGLGVKDESDGYSIDHEFWDIFKKTKEGLIRTDLVPQADDIETVKHAIRAIDQGYVYKPQIERFMEEETGKDWAPRQADYYAHAGYQLGYVHKDLEGRYEGKKMRKWGLTRDGEEYVQMLDEGREEEARRDLLTHIENMEISKKVLPVLKEEKGFPHSRLKELIAEYTQLKETTAARRASTLGQWFDELSYVHRRGHGGSLRYEYQT